jgi:hypothetical protein
VITSRVCVCVRLVCKFCPLPYAAASATLLCDAEIARTLGGDPIACDEPICVHCAQCVGEMDFCPKHRRPTNDL